MEGSDTAMGGAAVSGTILSISMFPFPHRDYAGVSLPRTSGRDIGTYHPFIKTKHPFAASDKALFNKGFELIRVLVI